MRSFKLDEFVAHGSAVNCLRIGRNTAGVLATGGEDKKVNLWRIGQPHVLKSLTGLQSPVECVTFDGSENQVAAGAANGTVKVWDLESGKVSRSLTGHRSNCLTLEFHPLGPFLASGSLDTNVKVWDLRRKEAITTFKGHSCGVGKLAISPDGKWVCSGSQNGEVKLWDQSTGRVVKDGWCHDGAISGIEFHPFEFILATASADRCVKIWDLEVWEQLEVLGPEATPVQAIAYHRDGRQLLAGSADGLRVWGCEPAVHHDTVPMDWRQLADMHVSYKDDAPRVVGCCVAGAAVGVFLVDLRKVAPFAHAGADADAALVGSAGGAPLAAATAQQQQQQCKHPQLASKQPTAPQLQLRGGSLSPVLLEGYVGRPSRQPQQQPPQPPYGVPGSPAGSSPAGGLQDGPDEPLGTGQGPLMRQLSRQRAPPQQQQPQQQQPQQQLAAVLASPKQQLQQQQLAAGGADVGLKHHQPGQLTPPGSGAAWEQSLPQAPPQQALPQPQQPQPQPRQREPHFPEFEVRVPAGAPPAHLEQREQQSAAASRGSSSRSLGIGRRGPGTANGAEPSGSIFRSAASSRRASNTEPEAPSSAVTAASASGPRQQEQQPSASRAPAAGSRSSSNRARAAGPAAADAPARATPPERSPVRSAGPGSRASSAAASRVHSARDLSPAAAAPAPAGDPIVAAMAARPALKGELARMAAALQVAKGFAARGNLEGAYRACHGDAALACMLVEAVSGRPDAFELGSLEPLLKLLELLLTSGQEQQAGVGLAALGLVLRGPGQTVAEVCGAPRPVGVDLSFEARRSKCLLVKMALEGLGLPLAVLGRSGGHLASRAQLLAEELKRVVDAGGG